MTKQREHLASRVGFWEWEIDWTVFWREMDKMVEAEQRYEARDRWRRRLSIMRELYAHDGTPTEITVRSLAEKYNVKASAINHDIAITLRRMRHPLRHREYRKFFDEIL